MRTETKEETIRYSTIDEFVEIFNVLGEDVPKHAKWELLNVKHEGDTTSATLKFWWEKTTTTPNSVFGIDRFQFLAIIPSLEFTHPDTKFWLNRQYDAMTDTVEYTVHYCEPGEEKYRIDLVLDSDSLLSLDGPIGPRQMRILFWGKEEDAMKLLKETE